MGYFMAGRRSALDPIRPATNLLGSVRVRTGPEQTSNGSAAWTFKTDPIGPNTDSDGLRFGLSSSIGPATGQMRVR